MRAPTRILVIDDDPALAELVSIELGVDGYVVAIASDGHDGLLQARRDPPDLVLLDRTLPGLDGLEVCRRLRATSDAPILMLTALGDVAQRIEGLEAGATDYMAKPFALAELLARVRAQLRLYRPAPRRELVFADVVLDPAAHAAHRGMHDLGLTAREFALLAHFMRHPRQVLPRAALIEAVWGWDFAGEEAVLDAAVSHLRQKLEAPGLPRLVHTVRGVGFVLRD